MAAAPPAAAPATEASGAAEAEKPFAAPAAVPRGSVSLPWPWISAALALLWIATLGAWYLKSRQHPAPAGDGARAQRRGELRRQLKAACSRNDPRSARDSLLALAQLRWPEDPPRSIGDFAGRSDAALASCLRALDAHLYGRTAGSWDGAALWQAFAAAERVAPTEAGDPGSDLEPLHRI
jgi:hypothetical protein